MISVKCLAFCGGTDHLSPSLATVGSVITGRLSPDVIALPCSMIASCSAEADWLLLDEEPRPFPSCDKQWKRKQALKRCQTAAASTGLSHKRDSFGDFFSSPKFFNMWRPNGAMWYSLAINPPSATSFRELNQTLRSGGICPAPGGPLLLLPSLPPGRESTRQGPGTDFNPGAPGGLWHTVSDGASAGFPLCHWLLALLSGERGPAAVWQLWSPNTQSDCPNTTAWNTRVTVLHSQFDSSKTTQVKYM